MARPGWAETWTTIAEVIASRSLCTRAQIGAVITDRDNRVVATGYNGPPAGFEHGGRPCTEWCPRSTATDLDPDYADCLSLHAEMNAIAVCDQQVRAGGSIYVTGHVCMMCAKIIANSGLKRVFVHVASGAAASHRQPDRSYALLRACGVEVTISYDYQEGIDC